MTASPTNPHIVCGWGIRPWSRADQDGVVALISGIQRGEFGLAITPAFQPDLLDIPGFYRPGAGEFWVAHTNPADTESLGEIVGCIALLDIGQGQGALRKMFVHERWRGPAQGIAAALLRTLLEHAAASGLREIFLGTTTRFLAAHRFYEKHGFARLEKTALPERFPVMAVDSVFYRRKV